MLWWSVPINVFTLWTTGMSKSGASWCIWEWCRIEICELPLLLILARWPVLRSSSYKLYSKSISHTYLLRRWLWSREICISSLLRMKTTENFNYCLLLYIWNSHCWLCQGLNLYATPPYYETNHWSKFLFHTTNKNYNRLQRHKEGKQNNTSSAIIASTWHLQLHGLSSRRLWFWTLAYKVQDSWLLQLWRQRSFMT